MCIDPSRCSVGQSLRAVRRITERGTDDGPVKDSEGSVFASLVSAMAAKSAGRSHQYAVESLTQGYLAMSVNATYPGTLSTRLERG